MVTKCSISHFFFHQEGNKPFESYFNDAFYIFLVPFTLHLLTSLCNAMQSVCMLSVQCMRTTFLRPIYNRTIKSIYEQNICDLVIPSKFELTVIYIHVFMNVLDMQQLVTKKRILYSLINTDCNMFTIFFFLSFITHDCMGSICTSEIQILCHLHDGFYDIFDFCNLI